MDLSTRLPGGTLPAVNAPRPLNPGTTTAAQRAAAQTFEGQVLGAMLQPMFAGLDGKGLFGGGTGEAQWQPMLVQEMGNAIARQGGLGLAEAVIRQMQRNSR
ncbi:rod-binding protein [Falsiroseomonas ponticola]|uniref:rod-binding protein n=1 Tax=Falsiroseomonas ponticola TaxID=2786951 RepID=UPI0019318146|nr:rod-binding protein [Roseomonas ponticola]